MPATQSNAKPSAVPQRGHTLETLGSTLIDILHTAERHGIDVDRLLTLARTRYEKERRYR